MYKAYVRDARVCTSYKRTETAYGRDFKGITAGTFFFSSFFRVLIQPSITLARGGRITEEYYISRRALAAIPRALASPTARVRLPPHPTSADAVPGPGPEMNVFRIKPPPPPPPRRYPIWVRVEFVAIEKYYIYTRTEGSRETATAHTPI